jgi:putative nucleotidyltransferase with HDIG domain
MYFHGEVVTPFTEAHRRRVAGVACEIARRLNVAVDSVWKAAFYHDGLSSIASRSLERLLSDVSGRNPAPGPPRNEPPADPFVTAIADVAHAFELRLAFAPYEPPTASGILDDIAALGFDSTVVGALRSIGISETPPPSQLAVYPTALFKALALLRNEAVSLADLERIVHSDQVMSSSLLSVANTAFYAPDKPIKAAGRAIAHIGLDAAKKVIVAAAARPLFASAQLRGLWRHSVDVAAIAERLARKTGKADTAEAFAAGLIHDIGRLAIELLPQGTVEAYHRIAEEGQCLILADMAVLGCDHGEYGARVIEQWALPEELVSAVGLHHRPELSDTTMPRLLFLAEFVSQSDEDIPSIARLKIAMDALVVASVGELFERNAFDRGFASALALAG